MIYNDLPKVNCEDCIWYKGMKCMRKRIEYLFIHDDGVQCSEHLSFEELFGKDEENEESDYEKFEY